MRTPCVLLSLALLLGVALPPARAQAAWSAEEIAQLKAKPRIVRRDGGVTARFFVKAPVDRAYAILTDHARLPEFMPNMDTCRVLRQGPGWAEVEMSSARGTMVLRRTFDPPRRITWRLVEGRMLKRVDGAWLLDPVEGGAILTYDSEVQTSVPVPAFLVQAVQKDALDALVSNVQQRIESNGTWTKPGFKKGSSP